MEYFYIFKNIDYYLILKTILQFVFFYILIIYCKFGYYSQLVEFEKYEKGKIIKKNIFFIRSFLYISLRLLIIPFFVLLVNSFEEPNFTATKYAFTSSFIIVIYCFIKTYLYTHVKGGKIQSTIDEMINENKEKLNKKPNG